jgi:hypothetical protein
MVPACPAILDSTAQAVSWGSGEGEGRGLGADEGRAHGEYVVSVPDEAEGNFETGFATGFDGGWEGSGEEISTAEAVPVTKRRIFRWLRTHSKESGLENGYLSRKWSMANFKLVDETGRLVAVFESNGVKSFRKQGKLKIYRCGVEEAGTSDANIAQGRGPAFELMIVLSFCVVEEKFRRGV